MIGGRIELPCMDCGAIAGVAGDATDFDCSECGASYAFRICAGCGAVDRVPTPTSGREWRCTYCLTTNTIPRRGGGIATAVQLHEELAPRGLLTDSPISILGGFTVIGGNGFPLIPGDVCSVLALPDSARIMVEIGGGTAVAIAYADITSLELGGGKKTSGTTFFGGGFGLQGALEGIAAASILNSLSSKTVINTGFHVGSVNGEAILHHGAFTPELIRRLLSALWTRTDAAKRRATDHNSHGPRDPIEMLRRLGELRDSRIVTEEEFAAKKAELLPKI